MKKKVFNIIWFKAFRYDKMKYYRVLQIKFTKYIIQITTRNCGIYNELTYKWWPEDHHFFDGLFKNR
jgi:hypothetical protein